MFKTTSVGKSVETVTMFLLVFLFCASVYGEYYDTFTGIEIPRKRFQEMNNLNLVPWCAIEVAECDPHEPRRMDLSCNNLHYPSRGAYITPFSRMLPAEFNNGRPRLAVSGRELPLARPLRVSLLSDGRIASKRFTQMVVNYAVFVIGDITTVHDTANYVALTTDCCLPGRNNPQCAPMTVPADDLHLRRSGVRCLNLTVPITYQGLGCTSNDVPPERINMAAPMLELSGVYGHDSRGASRGRLWEGGLLRTEMVNGREWPPDGAILCLNNEPPNETRCHDAPAGGINSLLGINLVTIWYYRQHNAIARELQTLNPCWDDDKLYYTAREINIALAMQIFYYDYLPEIMDRDYLMKNKVIFPTLDHVDDYNPSLEPRLSIEFVTATRWFHTIQEGRLKLYTPKGDLYDEKMIVDFTLRTGALAVNNTLSGITQGAFRQAGAAVDGVVDPDIGERSLGRLQFVSDVVSADIMKGRLLGLPPYNQYRRACNLPSATSFEDLRHWMEREQVDAMSRHYESVEDIDLLAGLLAERSQPPEDMGLDKTLGMGIKKTPRTLIPATLACIMTNQLRRWRQADRFWYEHPDHPQAFTRAQLHEIRRMTTAALICRHGDDVTAVQRRVYLRPGKGNEFVPCSEIDYPDLSVFKDNSCKADSKTKPFKNPH